MPANPIIAAHQYETEMMPGSDTQLANLKHQQNLQIQANDHQNQAASQAQQQNAGNQE
jgi:hypothetical protein